MHPQAVVVDAGDESALFLEAMRSQVNSMGVPLIELPEDKSSQLSYLTKLDSSSLAGKHARHISRASVANQVQLGTKPILKF